MDFRSQLSSCSVYSFREACSHRGLLDGRLLLAYHDSAITEEHCSLLGIVVIGTLQILSTPTGGINRLNFHAFLILSTTKCLNQRLSNPPTGKCLILKFQYLAICVYFRL